jgi:opacity protein-like surface antigen
MLNSVWLVGQNSETEDELTDIIVGASSSTNIYGTFNDLLRSDQLLNPIDQTNLDGIGDVEAFLAGAGVPTGISGEVKTWGLLANVYYDFMPEQKFSPYVSGGLGAARHTGELTIGNVTDDASDTVFAYQLGAGASYDIAEHTALFGGYRYFGTSDADFDGLEADYDAHELRVGIRYGF